MDRFHELEVLVAVAETGGFARAAARLRLSPAAVTRAVAGLEERLGIRLFHRTTRRVSITEAGGRYLESARRLLDDLETAEKEAAGETATPQGHLVITASVTFGRSVLAPLLRDFLAEHPRVGASLLLLDRIVNLVDEGVDLAVRIGNLPDSSLAASRVGSVRRILVASPAYLERRGVPASPADLKEHDIIGFTGLMPNREIRLADSSRPSTVSVRPRFEVNDAMVALEAARAGQGITLALSYMVREEILRGTLAAVLPASAPPPQPVHLVHPGTRLVAPKVRAFLEFASPRLRRALFDLAGQEDGRGVRA